MSILLVMPCYNSERSIISSISVIQVKNLKQIDKFIIIDNDSEDNTILKIQNYLSSKNNLKDKFLLLKNTSNYGLGGSLKNSFVYALENCYEYVIIIHADEQGNNNIILKNFLTNISKEPNVDFWMASRFLKESNIKGYNKFRILGNHFFNFLTFLLTGIKMSDSGCGIIALKTKCLKKINFLSLSNSFYFNPQLNVFLHELKNIYKKDIPLNWTDANTPSTLNVINYLFSLTKFLITHCFSKKKLHFNTNLINKHKKEYPYVKIKI